ncbi:hypothetical protein [Halomarina litorea]|uniref:hypothetical protein n=1 Tax=Halomarina litorea TaxID=2961595 RepID=UPI0020C3396B|nr:hypothetical protein [Halomarina sp. BCD28]
MAKYPNRPLTLDPSEHEGIPNNAKCPGDNEFPDHEWFTFETAVVGDIRRVITRKCEMCGEERTMVPKAERDRLLGGTTE